MKIEKEQLEELLKKVDAGEVTIVPHWVYETTEQSLLDGGVGWLHYWQTDAQYQEEYPFLRGGVVLIEVLFANLLSALPDWYREYITNFLYVYQDYGQSYTILTEWREGVQLTAPACMNLFDEDEVRVLVGNHRLNTAYRLGISHVPLLIPKAQLPKFRQLLGDLNVYEQQLIEFKES
ncbi:hypothetical protein DNI29_23190 [Hymenobacter sediminis]|uniref:hypothetical protein n=1 Tax=Hymenobacter sediminis TaxID=2218621 RepID=UPI000DA65C15|nr:hypothetical protein [Hymenobacter sediminis]RPD43767.1 hypothetical protein DNI29_23190 [Hymenobacter sediminis]